MSMISDRHSVVPFVAGKTVAFPTQRLAKVGYKTTKKTPAKFANIAVSVPMIEEWSEDQNKRLFVHVRTMLENGQDGIIRSLYESADGMLQSVSDADISVDQVIAFLEAESTGDRLTKDKIVAWFDENMKDNLSVVIAEKLGTENLEDVRVTQHLAGYRALFGSMSKDSGALQEPQIKGLQKALEVTAADDEISVKLAAKLAGMLNRPKMEELLDL